MAVQFDQYEKDLALDVLGALDEYGWWGGTHPISGEKHLFCLGEAVVHVLKQRQDGKHVSADFSQVPFCRKLVHYWMEKGEGYGSVPSWNDVPHRKYEDVQALLKEVATWELPMDERPRDSQGGFVTDERG